jgi:hypothetical protein
MENRATHILDFCGTGTTPGQAYFCADGPNKGGHAPIMDKPNETSLCQKGDHKQKTACAQFIEN